ncbi:MAG: hypothetical protein ACXV3D_06120 [Halobacteriota archaeon]
MHESFLIAARDCQHTKTSYGWIDILRKHVAADDEVPTSNDARSVNEDAPDTNDRPYTPI